MFRSTKVPSDDVHRMTISDFNSSDWELKNFDKSSKQLIKLKENFSTSTDEIDPYMSLDIESESEILLKPMTRFISHDQLIVEVKSIYAGLKMLKAKCFEMNEKHFMKIQKKTPSRRMKSSSEQWQALIVLHKALLHEHHNFFLLFNIFSQVQR